MADRHIVCPVNQLPPGEVRIVEVDDLPHSIGVFNIDGEFYGLANMCPHQLAPLCQGQITGEMNSDRVGEYHSSRDGEVIQCPWHGWKFNIKDGTSVFNPHKLRTMTYEASVEKPETVKEDEIEEYGTALMGDEPPVERYDVAVEESGDEDLVVVYA